MSTLKDMIITRILKGEISFNDRLVMLGNSRLNLFRKAPCCPNCKTQQVQCIKRTMLAKWRCRHCKQVFIHEPLEIGDNTVVINIKLLIKLSGDWYDDNYFDLYLPNSGIVVGTDWKTHTFKPHSLVVDKEAINWIDEVFLIKMRYTDNTLEYELEDIDYEHLGDIIGYDILLIGISTITLQDGRRLIGKA